MNKENTTMIEKSSVLNADQTICVFNLWNNEYPSQLAYENLDALLLYLQQLKNVQFFFATTTNHILGCAFAFEREQETWFAILVSAAFQHKKVGTQLLHALQQHFNVLNGWVIDHGNDTKRNGEPYYSPMAFYLKNGFQVHKDVRLEIPTLSAVKVQWTKPTFITKDN
jgi:GNAT superfamily N-acetyltransferase